MRPVTYRVQKFRQRNKDHGRCLCGQPRRPATEDCPAPKTCEVCHARNHDRRVAPVKRTWVSLHSDHEPELLAEWYAFSDEFDIPLAEAIEAAMELYIAIAHKERDRDAQQAQADALRLVG